MSAEARAFASCWIAAEKESDTTSDYHMNLLALTLSHPLVALGLLINIIDLSENDDKVAESVAVGALTWFMEQAGPKVKSVLDEAVSCHRRLELYTRSARP